MNDLQLIKDILVCPACRSGLDISRDDITCANCKQVYPIYENIPQFAIDENVEASQKEVAQSSAENYQKRYVDFEKARNYNLKYERKLLKRLSTRREYQILRRLLAKQGRCQNMLEIPCGGGRISSQLANATDLLIQADIGLGQILYGMTSKKLQIPQIWMTASGFRIPIRDAGVDAAVCIRLSHHLTTMEQRESLLVELLRVARRYVIMTFFDYHSIKNILRRLRNSKPKLTMTVSQISSVAAANDARLISCPRLSIVGSGHRYALIVKAPSKL